MSSLLHSHFLRKLEKTTRKRKNFFSDKLFAMIVRIQIDKKLRNFEKTRNIDNLVTFRQHILTDLTYNDKQSVEQSISKNIRKDNLQKEKHFSNKHFTMIGLRPYF